MEEGGWGRGEDVSGDWMLLWLCHDGGCGWLRLWKRSYRRMIVGQSQF